MPLPPTNRPLVLDGATGTELERRGYQTSLPLWTARVAFEAPDLLAAIHTAYVSAGSDVITACTFRTTRHTLRKAARGAEAESLTRASVRIARECALAAPKTVQVAGSVAPLEDCYHPHLTPDDATLQREHTLHVENLIQTGVDLLLVETMPTLREAVCAARIATSSGIPTILSLIINEHAELLDGSPLGLVIDQTRDLGLAAWSVNCAPISWCDPAVSCLVDQGLRVAVYPNAGTPDGSFGNDPMPLDRDVYLAACQRWIAQGAVLVGGCCGTGPSHIQHLAEWVATQSWECS